jgi:hypothetical protein
VKNTKEFKKALDAANTAKKLGSAAYKGYKAGQQLSDKPIPEDMARIAAEIASIADPTGAASVVAAYTYPKCSKYFGNYFK